ncbi:hypothetical protein L2E82_09875 [Cichorium intybus]|uniref:Uncharacterized protein n=1 Tax=Cichorium intybus TaxID=13427 RepID=A0ACB9G9Y6_CICIN|nr:hypothetical protein L2E82_09875 [Cichorium intybus]
MKSQQKGKRLLVVLREAVPKGRSDGQAPWPFVPEAGPAFRDIGVSPPMGLGNDWMITWYAIVVQEVYGKSMDSAPCTPFVACTCQPFSQVVALGSEGKLLLREQPREVVAGAVGCA